MSKKINAPPVWREEITQYLDVLKAGGQSKGTLTTRRCQLSQMARDLQGVPADVSDGALVSWFARHEWKPETRKSYRNAVTGFFSWLHTTGRAAANPAEALPSVRRPHAHPRPCPDSVILAALGRANAAERTMIRLAAEAGLRRAEIAAVHSRDVMRDLVGRSLIVRGKGDKQRIVPISDELADTITAAHGYGHDISTEDPHLLVAHYIELYGNAAYIDDEPCPDSGDDSLLYCPGISSNYFDTGIPRFEVFDDNYD
jgi:site-specific recombinase XerD